MEREFSSIEDRINYILNIFTEEYTSADTSFIKDIDYPIVITVKKFELEDENDDGITNINVEDLDELESVFKTYTSGCEVIIKTSLGEMTLQSRMEN